MIANQPMRLNVRNGSKADFSLAATIRSLRCDKLVATAHGLAMPEPGVEQRLASCGALRPTPDHEIALAPPVAERMRGGDLFVVDLNEVVGKYIGDTEKNLDRLFEAAAGAGVSLLFDEADAMFAKRTEVRDAHDRFANLEIAYLVQLAESHGGVLMLTTNMKSNLDPAFQRRLRFVVDFPRPEC